ncbi:MAG: hypothetical protein KDH88_02865 [Chromatiales bacterium]|nr:hypothetical protein [Chromatiales bacterium]
MVDTNNPYQAPDADLLRPEEPVSEELHPPRKTSAGHGWQWIADGWKLFAKAPLIWVVNILILFAISFALALIPLVSLLLNLLSPVFVGGLMAGCADQDAGRDLTVGHLFEGFKKNTGALIGVGLLYLIGIILISLLVVGGFFLVGGGMEMVADMQSGQIDPATVGPIMAIVVLLIVALVIPLAMAYWFAPALVMQHNLGSLEAMKLSFRGCLKNIVPFLIYGIVLLVLGFLAMLPLFLGLLVLGPVVVASIYTGYRDIFLHR